MPSEISQIQQREYHTISLLSRIKKVQLQEADSKLVVSRGSGRGNEELISQGYKF